MFLKHFFILSSGGLIILLGLSSCVKDIIMDAKERPEVAVACILSDDPIQELNIVYTKGASLKEAPKVMEAEALLKDLTTGEIRKFERQEDGVWRIEYAAAPRHKYKLEVSVPGYDTIWAEDTMPDSVKVNVRHNFWLWEALEIPLPETVESDVLPRGETTFRASALNDPVWIYAMNYNPITGQREIVDEICSGYDLEDDFNLIGRTYASIQWEEHLPFPPKPYYADLLANINTKALYPCLDGKQMHKKYIRIPSREMDGYITESFAVSGSFNGNYNCPDNFTSRSAVFVHDLAEDEGYVVWTAVSEVLDKYLKDSYELIELEKSTDLSAIYLRDNHYANVKDINGYSRLGIFGCKIERKCQWSAEGIFIDERWPHRHK